MNFSKKKIPRIEKRLEKFSGLIRVTIKRTSSRINQEDIDDIEQEVKIKIWKELLKSEKKIYDLNSYICRVAYTTTCSIMKDFSKQKKMLATHDEEETKMSEQKDSWKIHTPDYHLEKQEIMEFIRKSVDSLINSRRQVVKLYLLGRNSIEIAEFFGWSEGKSRNLLYRGLADLKNILRKDHEIKK